MQGLLANSPKIGRSEENRDLQFPDKRATEERREEEQEPIKLGLGSKYWSIINNIS